MSPCLSKAVRHLSELSHLSDEMTSRRLPYIQDNPTCTPSKLLSTTLADFLPNTKQNRFEWHSKDNSLYKGHHLVYFPPNTAPSSLLPDGTDPLHSPGPPFTRRMWAGGLINFHSNLTTNGSLHYCRESINEVKVRGQEPNEKLFVTIGRSIHEGWPPRCNSKGALNPHPLKIYEQRTLVFMRERPEIAKASESGPPKILKPTEEPDYFHSLTPTPALLFRFSALTYNAHAIHFDKQYCQEVEGHRNLLVHGPLSLVLMLEVLRLHLSSKAKHFEGLKPEHIQQIEYRNLAPLYVEEEMRICVKWKSEGNWDVWIEGRDGGYAVKGHVKTKRVFSKPQQNENETTSPGGHSPTISERYGMGSENAASAFEVMTTNNNFNVASASHSMDKTMNLGEYDRTTVSTA